MPKVIVQIKWDTPDDAHWLNADNIALALHAYCKNTHFVVQEAAEQIIAADQAVSEECANCSYEYPNVCQGCLYEPLGG